MLCAGKVFGVQQRQKFRITDEITPCEPYQGLDRILPVQAEIRGVAPGHVPSRRPLREGAIELKRDYYNAVDRNVISLVLDGEVIAALRRGEAVPRSTPACRQQPTQSF